MKEFAVNLILDNEICQKQINELFTSAITTDHITVAGSLVEFIQDKDSAHRAIKTRMKKMVTELFESMDSDTAFDLLSVNRELNYSVARYKLLRDINKNF